MEKLTKENLVKEILALAKAKQGKEKEKCVELSEDTNTRYLGEEKKTAVREVADTIGKKYNVKFPDDPTSVGTISEAADYVLKELSKK